MQATDTGQRLDDDEAGGSGAGGDADERRLADLGRRTIEMFTISHIFASKLQAAFEEEQALLRQEALIREEEEASRAAGARLARKAEADKERRAKKKVSTAATYTPPITPGMYGCTLLQSRSAMLGCLAVTRWCSALAHQVDIRRWGCARAAEEKGSQGGGGDKARGGRARGERARGAGG